MRKRVVIAVMCFLLTGCVVIRPFNQGTLVECRLYGEDATEPFIVRYRALGQKITSFEFQVSVTSDTEESTGTALAILVMGFNIAYDQMQGMTLSFDVVSPTHTDLIVRIDGDKAHLMIEDKLGITSALDETSVETLSHVLDANGYLCD